VRIVPDEVSGRRVGEHGEQVAVQIVHGVVVGLDLASPHEVECSDHRACLAGQRTADAAHLGEVGRDFGGHHQVGMATSGGLGDVQREITHALDWGALAVVAAVSLVIGVLIVVLVSLALVGLSARVPDQPGEPADEAPVIGRTGSGLSPRRRHGDGRGLPPRCGHHRPRRALPSRLLTGGAGA
jgi:hypothetical protein